MPKPKLEEIVPEDASSFYMIHQKKPTARCLDFWHFHPEYEIVYIPKGEGHRYIDNTISRFSDGDLFMLGPDIPHNTFYYGRQSADSEQYIIQVKGEKLHDIANTFREFRQIRGLLREVRTGICIEHESKHDIGCLIAGALQLDPFSRLLRLFQILKRLRDSKHRKNLGAGRYVTLSPANTTRLQRVLEIIKEQYQESLTTRSLARELSMTESSFCRFFAQATGKTFKLVLNEYRIQRACNLLTTTTWKVNVIAICVGFNSLPLFYKCFKAFMKTTPGEYRKLYSAGVKVV